MSSGLLHVVFKDEDYGTHQGDRFRNREVWNKVLLHQVCRSYMFDEGLLVVEEAAPTCRGRIHFCNSVVDSEFVVKKDGLLTAVGRVPSCLSPRAGCGEGGGGGGGGCLPRKQSVQEGG